MSLLILLRPTVGAAPVSPLPVTDGLTLHFEADNVSGDTGDPIDTWTNQASGPDATATGTARPTVLGAAFPTGQNGVAFDGTQQFLTVTAPTSIAVDVFPDDAFTVFTVAFPRAASATAAQAYDNHGIWATVGGYAGLSIHATGPKLQAFNFDTNTDTVEHGFTLRNGLVVQQRHGGGVLYGSVNGGTETSTASGDTGDLAGTDLYLGSGITRFADVVIGAFITYNRALTTQEVADVTDYLIDKYLGTDPVPATFSIYDTGHTASIRDSGHTASIREQRN